MTSKGHSKHTKSPSETWTDDLPVCKTSGVGFLTNQRYREDGARREEHEFEDRSFHFNVDSTYLYGVFDGHDGARAADFTVQRLPAELLLGQLTDDMSDEEIHVLLRQAFLSVEKGFFQTIDDILAERTELQLQIPDGLSSYEAYTQYPQQVARIQELNEKISGGTTAVVALIFNNRLYVANAGDSRALLCRQDGESLDVEQLSVDHDTQNENELLRLARLGLDIVQIQRNKRIGSQENTRSIGDYCVKGGYKDFDILSNAAEEPVIADPYIYGGIPVDKTFYALILMSDGVYKCLEEATGSTTANFDIVGMVANELQCQTTLNGVAQAVVDKVGRIHHDSFMQQLSTCHKRDDMTLLIRVFDEELTSSLSSPRSVNRSTSQVYPTSPGVLPVSVPFNPSKTNSGAAPVLKIPLPKRQYSQQSSQDTSSPSSTTSTPTNPTTINPTTVHSDSSSPSTSPSVANPPEIAVGNLQDLSTGIPDGHDGKLSITADDDTRIDPYVDFTDFFKTVAEIGEEVVYGRYYNS